MDNEHLFLMLDECISQAQNLLVNHQNLSSFAMVLEADNSTRGINLKEKDEELRYEAILEVLRDEAKSSDITAIALLSNVTIPDNFKAEVPTGIRIHIEEKDFKAENKLSARLLYVPYQLFKTKNDDTIQIKLHAPIPVGLACEIFVNEV